MENAFFKWTLEDSDLECCLELTDRELSEKNVEMLKNRIMEFCGYRLCDLLTETAYRYICEMIENLFPDEA